MRASFRQVGGQFEAGGKANPNSFDVLMIIIGRNRRFSRSYIQGKNMIFRKTGAVLN
jgi:hypothetical protein